MTRPYNLGHGIMEQMCAERGVTARIVQSLCRTKSLTAIRKDISVRLRAEGFSYDQIGTILNRDRDSIRYYVNDDLRAKKCAKARKRYHFKYFPKDVAAYVKHRAYIDGVRPSELVAKWITERVDRERGDENLQSALGHQIDLSGDSRHATS